MSNAPDHSHMLQQLLDNMTDNIFFKDRDSRFIMINEADAKWLGFQSPEEALGKSDYDLFTEEFAYGARQDELKLMQTGEPMVGKEEHELLPDGTKRWVTTSKVPLRDAQGNIIGLIGIGRDISDLKQKELELEEANRKLTEANNLISEDLQMAARLQQSFLPQTYPIFLSHAGEPRLDFHHIYEADSEIGGDFCAIYKLDENKAGLLICDVMGHGVRAALITSMIKTIADDIALSIPSPGEFLSRMNSGLHPMLQTEDTMLFATACYLTVDTENGQIEGALAGHTTPLHIKSSDNSAAFLDIQDAQRGPALAITPDFEFPTFTEELEPGDKLLLYTDGIYEALNEEEEEFSTEQLRQVAQKNNLSLEHLLPDIVQSVRDYAENNTIGDDVCLLGVGYNG